MAQTKTISEKEAYEHMFTLLLADEFMEFPLPKMGIAAMDTKQSWIEHICKQEGITVEDWNFITTLYLFMGYNSEEFLKAFRANETPNVSSDVLKAVKIHLKKKKWEMNKN